MYLPRNQHAESLFDDRRPWHQAEPHTIIEHGKAATGEHEAAPVDAGHALAIGRQTVFQPGFGGNILGSPNHIPIA